MLAAVATFGGLFAAWLLQARGVQVAVRLPDEADYTTVTVDTSGVWKEGRLQRGPAWSQFNGDDTASDVPAVGNGAEGFVQSWPQFRGPERDGRAMSQQGLLRQWPDEGPEQLWSIEVGEGHAGAAIDRGRVYLIDYDKAQRRDVIRCLSLSDGSEIWSYSYPVKIKWNYGMSRTVPAVSGDYVVAIGPLGHVHCLDAGSGELRWRLSLVEDYGAVVPSWYMGQCVLVDEGRVVLAPGGGEALMIAVSLSDGSLLWQTGAPREAAAARWQMTHSSIMPMDLHGVRQYVYAASSGVVSAAADDGRILWHYDDWRVPIATVPSPVPLPGNRVLLSAGYDAGMKLLAVRQGEDGRFEVGVEKHVAADVFGVEQHTPVLHGGRIYAISIVTGNPAVCLGGNGEIISTTGREINFERGPLLMVDDILLALTGKTGELVMLRATSGRLEIIGRHKVLNGTDAWAPMAVADGRLLLRDSKRLVCLRIADLEQQP